MHIIMRMFLFATGNKCVFFLYIFFSFPFQSVVVLVQFDDILFCLYNRMISLISLT